MHHKCHFHCQLTIGMFLCWLKMMLLHSSNVVLAVQTPSPLVKIYVSVGFGGRTSWIRIGRFEDVSSFFERFVKDDFQIWAQTSQLFFSRKRPTRERPHLQSPNPSNLLIEFQSFALLLLTSFVPFRYNNTKTISRQHHDTDTTSYNGASTSPPRCVQEDHSH